MVAEPGEKGRTKVPEAEWGMPVHNEELLPDEISLSLS